MKARSARPRRVVRRPNPSGRIARAPRIAREERAGIDHALLGVVYLARAWAATARRAFDDEVLTFSRYLEIGQMLYAFESFLRPDLIEPRALGYYFDAARMRAFHAGLDRDAATLPVFALNARIATEAEAAAKGARREGYEVDLLRAETLEEFAAFLRRGDLPAWMPSTAPLAAWGAPGHG